MSDTPTPRSYQQILGDMIDAFNSKQGIKNLRVGSPILSILEAGAQGVLRSSQDVFEMLNSVSLDTSEGLALERIGDDENAPKLTQTASTGTVDISDASFTKLATKLFQGSPAPIAGSVTIQVVDASLWPSSGKVYIGRGTPNYEGPISYTSKSNAGSHWTLNLATGTVKFHNTSETAILAQGGNRVVGEKTVVVTQQANVSDAIQFKTQYSVTIPDGETLVSGVRVVAQQEGQVGNVPAKAIKQFSTAPFNGASVTNPSPFSNGRETETDDDYRERIRNIRRSRSLGTATAIETAVTGITAPDENKRVSSAKLVERFGQPATLYIDDGTGYEEVTAGVPVETLADSAIGGEQFFEASHRPIARAFVMSLNSAPFHLTAGSQLAVRVGGVTYTHLFNEEDFNAISGASAYEVVASINGNPNLQFSARTAGGGTVVVLLAKSDINEDVEVVPPNTGTNANDALAFPAGVNYTAQLYKNDRLLTKDGTLASYISLNFSQWSAVTGSQTLVVSIDGTPAQTYTFVDQDFVDAQTGFTVLGRNTIAAWIKVVNAKIPGVTASENNGCLVLTSNAGRTNRASVSVTGGSLVTARFFATGEVTGTANDYVLNRNTAQLTLATPLSAHDKLTIGSPDTRAFVESGDIGAITLASTAKLWFVIDGDATIITTGVTIATTLAIAVTDIFDWGNLVTLTASGAPPFANVVPGDWIVLWDAALDTSIQGAFRVVDCTASTIVIERRNESGARQLHRSVSLAATGAPICKVLTCGGATGAIPTSFLSDLPAGVTAASSVYDPNTQTTVVANPMSSPRAGHTATLVPSGKVVVVGGIGDDGITLKTIESFDPSTGNWTSSAQQLTTGVYNHAATLLSDGKILITGGDSGSHTMVKKVYRYDPVGDTLSVLTDMVGVRSLHRAVLLPSNDVLIAGGLSNVSTALATSEIWSAGSTNCTATTNNMATARADFGLGLPTALKVTAIGSSFGLAGKTSYDEYVLGTGLWGGASTTIPSNVTWENKDVVKITSGHLVGLHGYNSAVKTTGINFKYDGTTWTTWASDTLLAETQARWRSHFVELKNGTATIMNRVASLDGVTQLSPTRGFETTGIIQIYDVGATGWSVPEPAGTGSVVVSSAGVAIARTDGVLREADVIAGVNYTASSIVAVLDAEMVGSSASVYKTNSFRVETNSFARGRDIALITQNLAASALELDNTSAINNLTGHVGSVESGSSELGTPSFYDGRVRATYKSTTNPESVVLGQLQASSDYGLVGLRNWWRGADGTSDFDGGAYFFPKAGSNYGFATRLRSAKQYSTVASLDTRTTPIEPWAPYDRAYLAAPFAIGPSDDLSVMVDNDVAKRFSLSMWRKLNPVGGTYSQTNTFKDGDAGGASLATTFGLGYDFNDFTVYMTARAKAFSAANMQMLFRYYRLGPDGNDVRIRFGNPLGPNQNLAVGVTTGNVDSAVRTDVTIRLQSGALRTPTAHTTTRVGQAVYAVDAGGMASIYEVLNLKISSAARTTNVTTLTLTLPASITDHGFAINDVVWVNSTNINFTSGLKTVTGRTGSTIQYAEVAADQGATANIGQVSFDQEGVATYTGGGVVTGDFIRLFDPFFITTWGNVTFRINTVDANGGYVGGTFGDQVDGSALSPQTTLTWAPLQNSSYLQVFANSLQTAATIVTELNALFNVANSTCPISATLLGSGAGIIDQSTPDFLDDHSAWYVLSDGVNWVQVTTSPGSTAGDYNLTFKNPTTGSLSTGADWANEVVHIVPSTTANVVEWLNTPTVSGLFTTCQIQPSNNGHNVQIATLSPGSTGGVQVQGGLANLVTAPIVGSPSDLTSKTLSTIQKSDSNGFFKGAWVRIQNENTLPLSGTFSMGMGLSSWDATGLLTFSSDVVSPLVNTVQTKLQFERQGRFVAISDMGMGAVLANFIAATAGCTLVISPATSPTANFPQASSANEGVFRILRVSQGTNDSSGTVYIENDSVIEERGECNIAIFAPSSPMPGDQLVIASPIFGLENQGTWTIQSVGTTTAISTDPFTLNDRFTVDTSSRAPVVQGASAVFDGTTLDLVSVVQGTPGVYVMRIDGISPNQDDGTFTDLTLDDVLHEGAISGSAGSIVTVLDKLRFPVDFSAGVDGYSYDTGLLGEVNRVIYGDPSDTASYPGVAAAGAVIDTSGPLVKRITMALALRVRSGVNNNGIADRVRSAVATVVNQTLQGQPVSLSAIVAAASKVVGVISVVVVSPTYNLGSDLIPVQPYEKPLVLDLDQDIKIAFLGD